MLSRHPFADLDGDGTSQISNPIFIPDEYAPGGSGLSTAVTDAVRRAATIPLDVSAQAVDIADPGESIDAVAAFVDHLETRTSAAPGLTCTTGLTTYDRSGIDGDAFHDTFQQVTPGTPVCFDIIPKSNTTVPPTLMPQLFRANVNVLGDGFTPLDSRVVFVTETEPGVRGDTASSATKPAILESGATILVPLFINEGDQVRVDTRTNSYLDRVKN